MRPEQRLEHKATGSDCRTIRLPDVVNAPPGPRPRPDAESVQNTTDLPKGTGDGARRRGGVRGPKGNINGNQRALTLTHTVKCDFGRSVV